MRASTAFLVGVGTVGLALAGGLGGGLVIGNMMSPPPPKHAAAAARAARPDRPAPQPMPAASALPYAAATLAFTDPLVDGSPPPGDQQADSGNAPLPPASVAAAAPSDPPADGAAARQPTQEPQQGPSAKQNSAADAAYAKARDSDLRHEAYKRRVERARRWAGRRDHDGSRAWYRAAGRGDGDDLAPHHYVDEAPRSGFPRIQLFGPDD